MRRYAKLDSHSSHGSDTGTQFDAHEPSVRDSIGDQLYDWIAFNWVGDLIELAQKRVLQSEDILALPKDCATDINRKDLRSAWTKDTSLPSALLSVYGRSYAVMGVWLLGSTSFSLLGPVFLNKLVLCAQDEAPFSEVLVWIIFLFASKVLTSICGTQYVGGRVHVSDLSLISSIDFRGEMGLQPFPVCVFLF